MNLQSMKRRAVPLHTEVADVLRHQILSGELASGSKLPALSKLTKQLGIARMTVVQAMNTLQEEGLIERFSGRGTFVREIELPDRETLHMKAELSQLHSMVSQLEVSVVDHGIDLDSERDTNHGDSTVIEENALGIQYRRMKRIHAKQGKPFCFVDIKLDNTVFTQAPERFRNEIVVTVLKDLDVDVASARQKVTISYADFDLAQALKINVNSAVFRVFREFFDAEGGLIYSATLLYPGDSLELEIDFAV